jgi:hypothetical protein
MKAISLGIAIDSMKVRAVEVVRGEVRWLFEAQRTPDQPLAQALAEFFSAWPAERPRWPRTVAIALSGEYAQMKRLSGLPSTTDTGLLAEVVQEGIARYFVTSGRPLRVGGIRVVGNGDVWTTAYDADLLDDLRRACANAKLRVQVVVPSISVLGSVFESRVLMWHDGRREVAVRFDAEHQVEDVRRSAQLQGEMSNAPKEADGQLAPLSGLAVAGPEAWRFADAYGAIVAGISEPTRYLITRGERDAGHSRVRLAVAAGALMVALFVATVAPGALATHEAARISRALRQLDPQRRAIAAAQSRLHQATRALEDLERFDEGRRPVLPLLAAITRRLPEGSAIVALRVDTLGGTLMVLGPRAAATVTALDATPGIASPEIIGPVTREVLNGAPTPGGVTGASPELERVTMRFRRVRPRQEITR